MGIDCKTTARSQKFGKWSQATSASYFRIISERDWYSILFVSVTSANKDIIIIMLFELKEQLELLGKLDLSELLEPSYSTGLFSIVMTQCKRK